MSTTETTRVKVLVSGAELYEESTRFVAEYLGRRISEVRGSEAIPDAAIRVLAEHGVVISEADALRIRDIIRADTVFDTEAAMATRAAQRVLSESFGDTMQVSGWIAGRTIRKGYGLYVMTGDACPRCEVNAVCYGTGGGVRCVNTDDCGYSYCA